jgi:hypothetical protein
VVEWEINTPPCSVLTYIYSPVWENLVNSVADDWTGLIITEEPMQGHRDIHALVSVPLIQGGIVCHGSLPVASPQARNRAPADPKLAAEYDFEPNG